MVACGAAVLPAAASAGTAVSGCPWVEFTRFPAVSTFPESNTQVYQCAYSAGPAHETVLRGRPPRARFWSFAVLDQARREVDSISDADMSLEPDGSYRISVRDGCGQAPNCLDVSEAPAPLAPGLIFYRVYVPEGDQRGGVALPVVTYDLLDGPDAEISAAEQADVLSAYVSAITAPIAPGGAVFEALASPSGLERPVASGSEGAAPTPERFKGLGAKQVSNLAGAGVPQPVIEVLHAALGQGGFGATSDNAYVTVSYDMTKGNLVLRAKAPTYRAQSPVPANDRGRSDGSEQVRYWSLCTTQATRPADCVRDERVVLDEEGFFDVVVSPTCPVAGHRTCLRSGALSAAGPAAIASLLYRNTIASESFFNEDGPRVCPDPDTMFCGDYALRVHYAPRP